VERSSVCIVGHQRAIAVGLSYVPDHMGTVVRPMPAEVMQGRQGRPTLV
jgi:hypothetical protein